jgi:ribonuclease HII
MELIAGVDEVGRGPLAGPVVAAAVILNPDQSISGLKDSKQLSANKREQLANIIQEQSLCYAFGQASVQEIDQLNILQASLLAMKRAVMNLTIRPTFIQVDGNFCPDLLYPVEAIIKGDQFIPVISAASIIAKVKRDREMIEWDLIYPGYGFSQHKGYPTAFHIEAIKRLGITPIHRLSFSPVQEMMRS